MENRNGLVVDAETPPRLRPCRADSGCRDDQGRHVRLGQMARHGLGRSRLRRRPPRTRRDAACGPEHGGPTIGGRRQDDTAPGLRGEYQGEEADRRSVRLDQGSGRSASSKRRAPDTGKTLAVAPRRKSHGVSAAWTVQVGTRRSLRPRPIGAAVSFTPRSAGRLPQRSERRLTRLGGCRPAHRKRRQSAPPRSAVAHWRARRPDHR